MTKTVEALCRELLENPGLFAALKESVKTGKVEDFLRAQDCGASPAELKVCLQKQTVELPEQDLERVAGGSRPKPTDDEFVFPLT